MHITERFENFTLDASLATIFVNEALKSDLNGKQTISPEHKNIEARPNRTQSHSCYSFNNFFWKEAQGKQIENWSKGAKIWVNHRKGVSQKIYDFVSQYHKKGNPLVFLNVSGIEKFYI